METLIELRRDPTYAELRAELLLLRAAILLCPLGPGEGMEINFAGQRVALTWEARARYEAPAPGLQGRVKGGVRAATPPPQATATQHRRYTS